MLNRCPDSISDRVRLFSLRISQLVSPTLDQESKFSSMLWVSIITLTQRLHVVLPVP